MAKFFETDDYLKQIIESEFEKLDMYHYGVDIKIMSAKKAKDLIKISKASPTIQHIAKETADILLIQVFEEALERLEEMQIRLIVEMAFSNVWFDTDKDKLNVENNSFKPLFRMRAKYGNEFMDILESGYAAIDQVLEEQKTKKEE